MKRVVRCLGCSKPVRLYGSFRVKMEEHTKLFLTGETKTEDIVGQLCRDCAELAGYKVKKKNEGSREETQRSKTGKKDS